MFRRCAALLVLAIAIPACRRVPRDPNEPGQLGGDSIVERICSEARFARIRLRSRCDLPTVDVVRVRAIVNGREFAVIATRDTGPMETDGPARMTVEYTLDGADVTAQGFGAVGAVPGLDEHTAKRLLEARLLENYWWHFHSTDDLAVLANVWPEAAARVAREPAGFRRDVTGWSLRYWGRSSTQGCQQITMVQAHVDARRGTVSRPMGRIYGRPLRSRYVPAGNPARCGLPLDDHPATP